MRRPGRHWNAQAVTGRTWNWVRETARALGVPVLRKGKDWTKVFPDALNAEVVAERLTERAEHFVMSKGYRTKS